MQLVEDVWETAGDESRQTNKPLCFWNTLQQQLMRTVWMKTDTVLGSEVGHSNKAHHQSHRTLSVLQNFWSNWDKCSVISAAVGCLTCFLYRQWFFNNKICRPPESDRVFEGKHEDRKQRGGGQGWRPHSKDRTSRERRGGVCMAVMLLNLWRTHTHTHTHTHTQSCSGMNMQPEPRHLPLHHSYWSAVMLH